VTWLGIRDEFLPEKTNNDTPVRKFGKVLIAESLVAVFQAIPICGSSSSVQAATTM
jgi:hypothetical protein